MSNLNPSTRYPFGNVTPIACDGGVVIRRTSDSDRCSALAIVSVTRVAIYTSLYESIHRYASLTRYESSRVVPCEGLTAIKGSNQRWTNCQSCYFVLRSHRHQRWTNCHASSPLVSAKKRVRVGGNFSELRVCAAPAPCACCSGSLRVALLYGTRRDESLLRALTAVLLIYYESALVSG